MSKTPIKLTKTRQFAQRAFTFTVQVTLVKFIDMKFFSFRFKFVILKIVIYDKLLF